MAVILIQDYDRVVAQLVRIFNLNDDQIVSMSDAFEQAGIMCFVARVEKPMPTHDLPRRLGISVVRGQWPRTQDILHLAEIIKRLTARGIYVDLHPMVGIRA